MHRTATLPALFLAATSLAYPALAQTLTPKDAWDTLAAAVDAAGGNLTSGSIQRDGDALIAPMVRLEAGEVISLHFDEIRLEPRGAQVAIIPSAQFDAVSTLGMPGERRDYSITHDGAFLLSADDTRADLALEFGRLVLIKTAATRGGQPLDERLEMTHNGLTGQMSMTLNQEPFEVRINLSVDELLQDQRISDPMLGMEQAAVGTTSGVRLEADLQGLRFLDFSEPGALAAAFEAGLAIRVALGNDAGTMRMDQSMMGFTTMVELGLQSSDAALSLIDGQFETEMSLNAVEADMDFGGVPVSAALQRFALSLGMPIIPSDDDRSFGLTLDIAGLTLSEELLAMAGAGSFADDAITAGLETRFNGRLLVDFADAVDEVDIPFDISSFELPRLLLQVGAASLTGSGRFDLAEGALERMTDDLPEGEGSFVFDLRGGNALLGRLAAIGLIPADQQFMAQMMMNALGRPVAEDHLRSEVQVGPGGAIQVNGMPLPF